MPITTNIVNSNLTNGEVYSIQHYVIKFVMTCDRLVVIPVSSTHKTDHHDTTKILLKVALNIITLTFRNYDKIKILLNYLAIMLFKGTMG